MTNSPSQTNKTQCRFCPQAHFASADNTACLKCDDATAPTNAVHGECIMPIVHQITRARYQILNGQLEKAQELSGKVCSFSESADARSSMIGKTACQVHQSLREGQNQYSTSRREVTKQSWKTHQESAEIMLDRIKSIDNDLRAWDITNAIKDLQINIQEMREEINDKFDEMKGLIEESRLYFEGRFDRVDAKLQETSQYVQATYSQVLQNNTRALEVLSLETADQGEKLKRIASNIESFHAKFSDESGTYGWDEDGDGKVSDVELERVLVDVEASPADVNAIRPTHQGKQTPWAEFFKDDALLRLLQTSMRHSPTHGTEALAKAMQVANGAVQGSFVGGLGNKMCNTATALVGVKEGSKGAVCDAASKIASTEMAYLGAFSGGTSSGRVSRLPRWRRRRWVGERRMVLLQHQMLQIFLSPTQKQ
jgi:hypothetical protein